MFAAAHAALFSLNTPKAGFPITGSISGGVLESVKNISDIDIEACKAIVVESFIHEYRDIQHLSPADIGKSLSTWDDVTHYYEKDCDKVLEEFRSKQIDFWVLAKINGKLVGWAIFQRENADNKSVYMDLLAVHPNHQRQGIGGQLLRSLITLQEVPDLNAINLLLRKQNIGGDEFYRKNGFVPNVAYQRDNWVDPNLLEGRTWYNPVLQHQQTNYLS